MRSGNGPSRRRILAHAERPFAHLNLRPGAPSRYESRGRGGVEKVDRDRIVDDSAQAGRCHRPAVSAAVLVKPSVHLGKPRAKAALGDAELDPTREAAVRPRRSSAWNSRLSLFPVCVGADRKVPGSGLSWQREGIAQAAVRRYVPRHVRPRPSLFRCQRNKAGVRRSAPERPEAAPNIERRAGYVAPTEPLPVVRAATAGRSRLLRRHALGFGAVPGQGHKDGCQGRRDREQASLPRSSSAGAASCRRHISIEFTGRKIPKSANSRIAKSRRRWVNALAGSGAKPAVAGGGERSALPSITNPADAMCAQLHNRQLVILDRAIGWPGWRSHAAGEASCSAHYPPAPWMIEQVR